MKTFLLVAAVLAVSGCAAQIEARKQEELNTAIAACKARLPDGGDHHRVQLVECSNEAMSHIYPPSASLSLVEASALSFAEKVNAGQITAADANLQMETLRYQIAQQEQAQAAAADAIEQARQQAAVANLIQMQQAKQPIRVQIQRCTYYPCLVSVPELCEVIQSVSGGA